LEVIILAYGALKELQETESHADEKVRQGEEQAKGILRDAKDAARVLIENARAKTITERKSIIEAEEAKAQAEADKLLEQANDECDRLCNAARSRIPRAVDLVVERIVTQSGNR
jgi:V/A-type H+-transporting ATPase subunit G/H